MPTTPAIRLVVQPLVVRFAAKGSTIVGGVGTGLVPLTPAPTGQFGFATVTVDQFGLVTQAVAGTDVASESTQLEILTSLNLLVTIYSSLAYGGVTGPGTTQAAD